MGKCMGEMLRREGRRLERHVVDQCMHAAGGYAVSGEVKSLVGVGRVVVCSEERCDGRWDTLRDKQ